MTAKPKRVRCAVYTRVSTEYGLDQEFNSLIRPADRPMCVRDPQAGESVILEPPGDGPPLPSPNEANVSQAGCGDGRCQKGTDEIRAAGLRCSRMGP